jgi:ABC-2 type transport system ATP-binding protein
VLVREHIRTLARQATVVVTTHDMEEAEKVSDRVCIIDHGRLLALDTVEEIKGQLGEGDVFEIELAGDADGGLLPRLAGLIPDHPSPSLQGNVLSFTSTKGAEILPAVLRAIEERGLQMHGLRVRPRTLEDVFIRLTGRRLRE